MKNGRNTAGQFASGNAGRPRSSRNEPTLVIQSPLEDQTEALIQTAIKKAIEGYSTALRT